MKEKYDILDIMRALQNDDVDKIKDIDVWLNKQYNDLRYKANHMGALSHCRLCGKKIEGKTNSHSVPQMILKNIDTKGEYYQPTPFLKEDGKFGPFGRMNRFGLNNAGTFRLICEACDKRYFSDYEKPDLWESVCLGKTEDLSDKILAEIYLKSALLERYKKEFQRNFDALLNERCKEEGIPRRMATISDELSVKEDDALIDRCSKIIKEGQSNQFKVIFFKVLDHSSDIAAQALFPIQKVPTGEVINDVFNMDPGYRISLIEMVVFPLKTKTVCLSFCLSEDVERLSPFINYLGGLSETAKMKLFQSTLFAFTEELYMNDEIKKRISQDPVTMSFIKSALELGKIKEIGLESVVFSEKPVLVATNNFRKAKLHL